MSQEDSKEDRAKELKAIKDKLHVIRNKDNTCYCERCNPDNFIFVNIYKKDGTEAGKQTTGGSNLPNKGGS
jgi:hypothetical protein